MARPKQKVSIISLAKEFGVSAPTISKALSNSKEVSESLRGRVRARADELGFTPKRPRRTTHNICVVLDLEINDSFRLESYQAAVVAGVYDFCSERKIEFSMLGENFDKLEAMDLTKELCRRNADAAVIIRAKADRKYIENLQSNRFPFVCVYDGPTENTITLNDHVVGELALNHLVELGHTRIAIARNVGRRASSGRFMGFVQAAAIKGLAAGAVTEVIPGKLETGYEVGHEILREWIANHRPWSAIFCTSDNVAAGILSEAVQQGIKIPSELSVLTCDDIVSNAEAAPPLCVVDIPNKQAGYLAAQHAWGLLTSDSSTVELPAPLTVEQVIHRASTTAPLQA